MILLLTDQSFERVKDALPAELFAELFLAEPELPEDRELVRMARAGEGPPTAIAQVRERRDAGRDAAETTRVAMNEMLIHIHGAGVPVSVLARWFDLKPSRIYEVFHSHSEVAQ